MNFVRMTHPEAGESQVPASAVPHWRASGWQVAEAEPLKFDDGGVLKPGMTVERNDSDEPEPVLTKEQFETPPRRRKSKEEE